MPSLRNEGPLAFLTPTTTISTLEKQELAGIPPLPPVVAPGQDLVKSKQQQSEIIHQISPPTTPTKKIKSASTTNNTNNSALTSSSEKQQHMVLSNGAAISPRNNQYHLQLDTKSKLGNGGGNNGFTNGHHYTNGSSNNYNNAMNQIENSYRPYLEPSGAHLLVADDDDYYNGENDFSTEENMLLMPEIEDDSYIANELSKKSVSPVPLIPINISSLGNVDEFMKSYSPDLGSPKKSSSPTSPTGEGSTKIITSNAKSKKEYNSATVGIDEVEMPRPKKIYKVVLTGGPCGGKTTGQARLCTFFENLGWKVFRVPESATVLLSGGIKFSELSAAQAFKFQEDLVKTMMHIESVFFSLAETVDKDVLIICDRGTMDASAFIPREQWEDILNRNDWNEVDIRDTRYHHIIHMVSAANGAEPFYTIEDHATRSEGLELACRLDQKAAQAWVGHPYFDVVDNSTDFETKVCRMIQCVCQKLGIDARDRLQTNSRKVKFLVKQPLPADDMFPAGFQDFHVVHDYLQTTVPHPKMQARLRKRGQNGNWSYTYTVRRPELQGQVIEVKTALTQRDYNNMLTQKDHNHVTIYKNRRCFLLNDQYFQLDIYDDPCHPRCKGLILLETYSTLNGIELQQRLPDCLTIIKEVTGDPRYSMFNLSLKDKWENNKNFCQSLAGAGFEDINKPRSTCESTLTGP